jgi:hypothetical protein
VTNGGLVKSFLLSHRQLLIMNHAVVESSITLSLFNSVSWGSLSLSLLSLASMASLNHIWHGRAATQGEPWPWHGDSDDLALHHDGRWHGASASTRHDGGSSSGPQPHPPPHRPRHKVGRCEEQQRPRREAAHAAA